MLVRKLCHTALAAVMTATTLQAVAIVPARNFNPVVLIHGLPVTPETNSIKSGDHRLSLQTDLSSIAVVDDEESDETLIFDGETRRVALRYEWGFMDRAVIGIDIPWIKHSGGSLDSFLSDYHDALGLPDGDRPSLPEDDLRFQYQRNGVDQLNFRESASGLGNISLFASLPMIAYPDANAALGIQINLPTGDADKLTGSDGASVALWLQESTQIDEHWRAWYSIGGMWLDDGEILAEQQESAVGFMNFGVGRQLGRRSEIYLQVDGHTKFYDDSDMKLLGDSVQLTVGASTRFNGGWQLSANLTEDIDTEASPDVVFNIALNKTFR